MANNTPTQDQIVTELRGELDTLFSRSTKIQSLVMKQEELTQKVIDMTAVIKQENAAIKADLQQLSDEANNAAGDVSPALEQAFNDLNAAAQERVALTTASTDGSTTPPADDSTTVTDANGNPVTSGI